MNEVKNQPPVYVYDTWQWDLHASDGDGVRFLDWLIGLRYMATSREWPNGAILAYGRTPEAAYQKGLRKLAKLGNVYPKRVL